MTFPGLIKVKLFNKCETSFSPSGLLLSDLVNIIHYIINRLSSGTMPLERGEKKKKNQDERDSMT